MTSTKTERRVCARLACSKLLHRRLAEKNRAWEKRRFCSNFCNSRCNGWGRREPMREAQLGVAL